MAVRLGLLALLWSGAILAEDQNPYESPRGMEFPAEVSERLADETDLSMREADRLLRRISPGDLERMSPADLERLIKSTSLAVLDRIFDRLDPEAKTGSLGARIAVARIAASRLRLQRLRNWEESTRTDCLLTVVAIVTSALAVTAVIVEFFDSYGFGLPGNTGQKVLAGLAAAYFALPLVAASAVTLGMGSLRQKWELRDLRKRVLEVFKISNIQQKLVDWARSAGCSTHILLSADEMSESSTAAK